MFSAMGRSVACRNVDPATCLTDRVPTVMEKHGKKSCHGKAWKMGKKKSHGNSKMSWKSHGISPLLIANHACEITIIPYLLVPNQGKKKLGKSELKSI